MKTEKQLINDYWSTYDCSANVKSFYLFPPIKSHSCEWIFGEPDASRNDWCEYWTVKKFLKDYLPFTKALSICCGFGSIERALSRLNVAKIIYGTDIAEGAINAAIESARREGLSNIKYFVADINVYDLPTEEYDLIWANGALHHIENLELVLNKLYKSLKKGGFFVCNEYVGPRYQQPGFQQQVLINTLRKLMPKSLSEIKTDSMKNKIRHVYHKIKNPDHYFRPLPVEWFLKHDPSEGISSEKIIPALKKRFKDIDIHPFGGTLLYFAFDETFYDNFDFGNAEHREYLEFAFDFERSLIDSQLIQSDNVHIICRKLE